MKLSLVPQEREYFRLFSEFAATLDRGRAAPGRRRMADFGTLKRRGARAWWSYEHVGDKVVHDIFKRLVKSVRHAAARAAVDDLRPGLDCSTRSS